jgi:serine/threonine-protein phosphatase 2B regulatory subunit
VTTAETKRLFKRFLKIDADKSGGIDIQELMAMESVAENPLAERIMQVFDKNRNGVIEMDEFLEGISIFSRQGAIDKKLEFIFSLYDINGDGFLSNGDVFNALKMMVGENLDDVALQVS